MRKDELLRLPLPQRIKQVRDDLGLTQEAFAVELHTGRRRVIDWESGAGGPDADHAQRIADVYARRIGVTLDPAELQRPRGAKALSRVEEQLRAELAALEARVAVLEGGRLTPPSDRSQRQPRRAG